MIDMDTAAVRRWGRKSADVGEHIRAEYKRVAAAGSEPTPGSSVSLLAGTNGFATTGAFHEFFTTWTPVVSGLGDTIEDVGERLTGSANTVDSHDDASGARLSIMWYPVLYGPTVER